MPFRIRGNNYTHKYLQHSSMPEDSRNFSFFIWNYSLRVRMVYFMGILTLTYSIPKNCQLVNYLFMNQILFIKSIGFYQWFNFSVLPNNNNKRMVLVMSAFSISKIKTPFDFDTGRFFPPFYSTAKLGQHFVLATKHAQKIYYISNLRIHPTSVHIYFRKYFEQCSHIVWPTAAHTKTHSLRNKKAYFCGH